MFDFRPLPETAWDRRERRGWRADRSRLALPRLAPDDPSGSRRGLHSWQHLGLELPENVLREGRVP